MEHREFKETTPQSDHLLSSNSYGYYYFVKVNTLLIE